MAACVDPQKGSQMDISPCRSTLDRLELDSLNLYTGKTYHHRRDGKWHVLENANGHSQRHITIL